MRLKLSTLFTLVFLFVIIVTTPSHSSQEKNDNCLPCMGSSGYMGDIESECSQIGPDWFARGYELTGSVCLSYYCRYTFHVICSREINFPSWPPDLLFEDKHSYLDTHAFCDCEDV